MAEPARNYPHDIEPETRPNLHALEGGNESPGRSTANLRSVDPQETAQSLANQENATVIQGPWGGTPNDVREAETNPASTFVNNVTGQQKTSKTNFLFRGKGGKPRWITIAIMTVLFGSGVGVSFLTPALLPIHVLENLIKKFDTQNVSLTKRTNKILEKKLIGSATSGSCQTIKIACRFNRVSNNLLQRMNKNGIKAFDEAGKEIAVTDGKYPDKVPKQLKFTDEAGTEHIITAKNLSSMLANNSGFRAALHTAYNPRFIGYMDSVFRSIEAKFGFSKRSPLEGAKDGTDATKRLNEASAKNPLGGEAADGGEAALREAIKEEVQKTEKKLSGAGKGNAVGLIAGTACIVADGPSLVAATARDFQKAQLIQYSAGALLAPASKIKADEGVSSEVSILGDILTKTDKNGKSAMDSFGMKYLLNGDTASSDKNYQKFSPGANVIGKVGAFRSVLSSPEKKKLCDVATNPITGAAVDAATSETIIGPILNLAVGYVAGWGLDQVITPLLQGAIQLIPVKDILTFFMGDLTKDLAGEGVGNAIVSGASLMMGDTANAGGNMPLSVSDAVAYQQTTNEVNLAYAQEDRATRSPFDITSPNTALGSIVSSMLPYIASIHSGGDILSTVASIFPRSLTSFLPSVRAADDATQYQLCDDPAIKDAGVAAGPFCNIVYGIPPQYLDMDPDTVVQTLQTQGQINDETGEPQADSQLQNWITSCADGSTDQLSNCKVTSETAPYAIYTIDHRIQKTMDDPAETQST